MHNDEYNKNLIEDSIKLQRKLSIIVLICTTLICIGPAGWLVLRILDNETEKLLYTALLTIPTLIYMTWSWCSFFYKRKMERELKELEDLVDEYERKLYKDK
ncbi:hypothetical protein [Faecalimicrobium dakarense]|uniref:hypothetical protein n=1 Tax=Faecalimicrobium dakarense TaxID=1301100 RepID=UPI0004BA299D|nr:hypothetical protein [[Clostridium] dakarense]